MVHNEPSDAASAVPEKWDATRIVPQNGKTAIVTGANSGIGFVTALELARHGANVVLACRSEVKGHDAVRKIEEELRLSPGAGSVEFGQLDVSSLASVKSFARQFADTHARLDLLINNAGIMDIPYEESVDGLEMQMATNHFGHFALTAQLFELLKASQPSRVVNVSSSAHHQADYDEDAVVTPEKKYSSWGVYGNSKLANLLFTAELARRCEANGIRGVTAVACHPGVAATNLMTATTERGSWPRRTFMKFVRLLPLFQSIEMGALPSLYAATAPAVKSGQYFGPDGLAKMWGYPALEEPAPIAHSVSAALKLWEMSERLTGTPFVVTK